MVKAVIFDLDGTLLNTLADLASSTNYALGHYGYPQRTIDEIRRFVGNGVAKLIERAVPEGTSEADVQRVLSCFKSHYLEHSLDTTVPYDGIMDMLSVLKKKGIATAIVSNKLDPAVRELHEHFFKELVDTVEVVRFFAQKYNHKIWISRIFNPLVCLGAFIFPQIPKMFSSSYYIPEMSKYNFDYQLVSFEDSIKDLTVSKDNRKMKS